MLVRVCAVVLTGSVAALILSHIKGSFSFAVRIGTLIVTLGIIITLAASALGELFSVLGSNGETEKYANIILRALGVALLGHFASLICRETGSESLSFGIELAAKIEIFVLCIPLIREIMSCAIAILKM